MGKLLRASLVISAWQILRSRHGCRDRRDLNVELGLLAFGSLILARGLEHVYPGLVLMQSEVEGMR